MSFYPRAAGVICVPLSFNANEGGDVNQAAVRVYFPGRAQITQVRLTVVEKLSAADAGTVTLRNSAGGSLGSASFPASTVIETTATIDAVPDFVVPRGDYVRLVPAKTTPGGAVLCFIEYLSVSGG